MKVSAAFLLCLSSIASASEAVTVLGLPLGGKLASPPPSCPFNTDNLKKICWLSSPFVHKDGSRIGTVVIPDPKSRPKWAAYSLVELSVKRDLTLTSIKVSSDGTDRSEIYQSISTRFGPPWHQTGFQSARWDREGVLIELLCASRTKCWATFRRQPTLDEQALIDKARAAERQNPISP